MVACRQHRACAERVKAGSSHADGIGDRCLLAAAAAAAVPSRPSCPTSSALQLHGLGPTARSWPCNPLGPLAWARSWPCNSRHPGPRAPRPARTVSSLAAGSFTSEKNEFTGSIRAFRVSFWSALRTSGAGCSECVLRSGQFRDKSQFRRCHRRHQLPVHSRTGRAPPTISLH